MTNPSPVPVFDGHNDVLSKLMREAPGDPVRQFRHSPSGAIDAKRATAGGFAGGLFAVWIPSPHTDGPNYGAMNDTHYDVPLPPEVPIADAFPLAKRQFVIAAALEQADLIRICTSVAEIEAAMAAGVIACVLHIEGAEAIGPDLEALTDFHRVGLRSLGPVWSRPNRFGHGVPFRYPGTPDTGPGLTADGIRLVKACDALNIMVDCSHITEAGFWDIARHTSQPLVATHSNVHRLCATTRNLTDKQLDAIAERGGMVGLNFATAFLREDGRMLPDVPLTRLIEHLDALIERLGEDHVGLGSDYDGAIVPQDLTGVDGLPRLVDAMAAHGYDDALIKKLCHANWLRALGIAWGE